MFDIDTDLQELRNKVHSEGETPTRRTVLILIDRIMELEKEVLELRKRDEFLHHLEANGVDNWEGYSRPNDEDDEDEDA